MPAPTRHSQSNRSYQLRGRSPHSNRLLRLHTSPEVGHRRPVLAPLVTNLRRRPSRLQSAEKPEEEPMPLPQTGSKRKRVPSANENAHGGGRPTRGSGRLKRLRSDVYEPGEASEMDVDPSPRNNSRWSSDEDSLSELTSDDDDDDEQDEDEESTDHHLIHFGSVKELQRLRKDELVRLYVAAGLSDDAEALTKTEIIDALVTAREDDGDLPPSSPRGVSSDEQDNDPNEDDEVHTPLPAVRSRYTHGLRRRATTNETTAMTSRPSKSRSLSMGNLLHNNTVNAVASSSKLNGDSISSPALRRRKSSKTLKTESSLRTSFPPHAVSSPPATRLRSRKGNPLSLSAPLSSASASSPIIVNNAIPFPATIHRSTALAKGRKGKGKQVEFLPLEEIEREKERQREIDRRALAEESDLTELDSEPTPVDPSPRRLRSKDKERERLGIGKGKENVSLLDLRRVTPARKAKRNHIMEEEEAEVEAQMQTTDIEEQEDEDDQLATPTRTRSRRSSHKAKSNSPVERTPLVQRLRSRTRIPPASGADGDDEQSDDDDHQSDDDDGDDEQVGEEVAQDGEEEEDEEGTVEGDEDEDGEDEQTIAVEPRKLRNGKIVGDDLEMEQEQEEAQDEDEEIEEVEEEVQESEGEADEMECENVDLTIATAKTLVRLRRDDLVRLCETRDLEVVGTKPQLAEALLQWRDRHTDFSSPSSTGTVMNRPPSTVINKRRRNASQPDTPVLLRSQRVHIDEPVTPEPKEAPVGEPELELDLESLGLDDREIPPDKLQKLEKIGSGGFKDVFIGKFRGRRIAISEFRGQLSAMDIKELKLLGGFDHPNIVRFLGVSIPEDTKVTPVMIVSELCSNGDLFDYVRNVAAPSLNKVLSIMLDIARGLEYLHLRKPSVIHRDCKSSNILITAKGTAKIADFGLAKVKQSTRSMVRSLVGTVNWQAPELWHAHPKYNHKVDVFSCAMVYWEMLQWHQKEKKFPWEGMNEHAIYEIVGTKKQRPPTSGLRKQWCPAIVDLIERMWAQQHEDRPTMSEVVSALEEMRK
ncbi:Protein kinase domain-containing protein [Mycena indigotica]|uniref:Protein kinase domain-containing protein n=1 Tax=Mycena indigotica TaxID=2126181 RepID=A0A8H6S9G4_9AGAR|nr:Protein kinase domain-containing protein [Mycena indigotica]KAF7295431.1 Protein kinase domain-containing protein [Mycena indigotica]